VKDGLWDIYIKQIETVLDIEKKKTSFSNKKTERENYPKIIYLLSYKE